MGLRIYWFKQQYSLSLVAMLSHRLLNESWEIGVVWSREISEMSTCWPTEF